MTKGLCNISAGIDLVVMLTPKRPIGVRVPEKLFKSQICFSGGRDTGADKQTLLLSTDPATKHTGFYAINISSGNIALHFLPLQQILVIIQHNCKHLNLQQNKIK